MSLVARKFRLTLSNNTENISLIVRVWNDGYIEEHEHRFLVHLSRRLMCTIVIMRCSSSVHRHSVFIFSTSSLKPLNGIQQNLSGSKISMSSTKIVFRADRKNKMAALASDWLRHFWLLLWNRWTEFYETWQEARSQCPLPSLCFSGRWEKQDGCPGLWLAETFSTSPLKPLNGIQQTWQEARSERSLPSLCFSGRSEKQDGCPGLWLAETF